MFTKNTVPGPGKPEAYTLDQVKDCLRRSAGVLAATAQKLGCERSAVYGTWNATPSCASSKRTSARRSSTKPRAIS